MKRKELEVGNQDSLPLSSPAQPAPSMPLFSPAACCGLFQISYRERAEGQVDRRRRESKVKERGK